VSILSTIFGVESGGGQNITQGNIGDINNLTGDLAQGYFQITGGTWAQFGGSGTGYSSAIQAPYSTQVNVAENIPVSRWGPATQSALQAAGYTPQPGETLGQMLTRYGENPADTVAADGSTYNGAAASGGSITSVGAATQSDIAALGGDGTTNSVGATLGGDGTTNTLGYPALGIPGTTQSAATSGPGYQALGLSPTGVLGNASPPTLGGQQAEAGATAGAGQAVSGGLGGIAGAITGVFTSAETFLGHAFVVVALVVLGIVFVAFGLGLFNKKMVAAVI